MKAQLTWNTILETLPGCLSAISGRKAPNGQAYQLNVI